MQPSSFKDLLTKEVKYAIAIGFFIVGVMAPFYKIQQDVALIKQNHYHHIEEMTKQIERCSKEIKDLNEKQTILMETIVENRTRIEMLKEK